MDRHTSGVLSFLIMGNRVYLELRGSELSILAEEDEEAVASLAANNSLPLFWLALLQEENLGTTWECEVRSAFANPDGNGIEPICLGWREAKANLAAARESAEMRLPDLFPLLRDWEAGLLTLAGQGPAQEVRLYLAEHANFYDSADIFIGRLREVVRLWHSATIPTVPPVENAGSDLTGFVWLTDEPFPTAFPSWKPGRPVPSSPQSATTMPAQVQSVGRVAEWGMVALFSVIVIGSVLIGDHHFGLGGMWTGGVGGFLVALVVVWQWAKRTTLR